MISSVSGFRVGRRLAVLPASAMRKGVFRLEFASDSHLYIQSESK